jgi:hypothetical protein
MAMPSFFLQVYHVGILCAIVVNQLPHSPTMPRQGKLPAGYLYDCRAERNSFQGKRRLAAARVRKRAALFWTALAGGVVALIWRLFF